jgi:hypothetical protein
MLPVSRCHLFSFNWFNWTFDRALPGRDPLGAALRAHVLAIHHLPVIGRSGRTLARWAR